MSALEGLTEGFYNMFSQRLELFRLELLEDVQRMRVWVAVMLVSSVVMAFGYGMLNLAVVLIVGAITAETWSMAVTAGVLAITNIIAAGLFLRLSMRHLKDARVKMHVTLDEFRRDRKWLREITQPSSEEVGTNGSTPT